MLKLKTTTAFHHDYKRAKKRELDLGILKEVVDTLLTGAKLPDQYYEHELHGQYEGFLECHLKPDWLLIYLLTPDELVLARTGTHGDLFEM